MKRPIRSAVLLLFLCAPLLLSGCAAPFSFVLRWGPGGSSYDSASGILIKTTDAASPDRFRTVLRLSREETAALSRLAEAAELSAVPDAPEAYDPFSPPGNGPRLWSKPAFSLELELRDGRGVKRIRCPSLPPAFFSLTEEDLPEPYDETGEAFSALVRRMLLVIFGSEEWRALPDYEVLYS